MAAANRQLTLKARPVGIPGPQCFEMRSAAIPSPMDGEILVRNLYASLDPAMRPWMDDRPSYLPPIPIGGAVRATTLGKVIESRACGFAKGDLVVNLNTLEDYSVLKPSPFTVKITEDYGLPITYWLSALGVVGLTGYFGLLELGKPKPGQTVLVSGAAGAVGSVVGQIARIKGCRAVGIAGGEEKRHWLLNDCGYDEVIDYKGAAGKDLSAAVREACPGGIDIYFDNVGGPLLEIVLDQMNGGARIVLCGAISGYNATEPQPGPGNLWQLIVKQASIEGFLIMRFLDRLAEGSAQMAQWLKSGRIKYREHIDKGLESGPASFTRLFTGDHRGKLILDIASQDR